MTRVLIVLVCSGLLFPCAARAQAPAPDVLGELLKEVRALRIAMERAATVGPRIQLLVARVQLQEQRITELSRRATAVREHISKVETESAALSGEAKRFEGALERGVAADERGHIERQIEVFKAQLAASDKRRQDLANEEALLSQQIAADQGRWTDVNSQLDQLERSLTPPRQ